MMTVSLVFTVIGNDRPGLVEELAATVCAHHGNWLESSMSHLAGKFAGIVRVDVPQEAAAALESALKNLTNLRIITEHSAAANAANDGGHRICLNLVGNDREGLVKEVSQVLARHALNVESLNTYTSSAAMSSDTLFHAEIEVFAYTPLNPLVLKADLERISNDLIVDIATDEISIHE